MRALTSSFSTTPIQSLLVLEGIKRLLVRTRAGDGEAGNGDVCGAKQDGAHGGGANRKGLKNISLHTISYSYVLLYIIPRSHAIQQHTALLSLLNDCDLYRYDV